MTHTDSQKAFESAILHGALSAAPSSTLFAGRYMYMGDNERGQHLFKHIDTRAYIAPVDPQR